MIVIGALLLIGLLGWALITSIDARIDAQPAARSLLPFDVWFVVPAVIGVAFALIRSGQFVTQMYSLKSSNHGLEFVLSTVFGLGRTTLVVSNGQIECMPLPATPESIKPGVFPVVPELKAHEHEIALQIGGPGILSVKSNNAVITERGGGFSRILAPGDHVLMSFERVRTVIDLRRQSFSSIETALTKDGIPAQSTVGTLFIIADQMPDEALPNPPLPSFMTVLRTFLPRKPAVSPTGSVTSFSREAVRMAVYETATSPLTKITWNATAHNGVAGQVRDTMSRRPLDQLFAPDDPNRNPRQEIGQEVFESGKKTLAKRGIDLIDCGFGDIVVPHEVIEQRCDTWQVNWDKESAITQANGEAEGILQYQLAHVKARAELIQAVTQAIRTKGQTSEQSDIVDPLTLRFVDAIAKMLDKTLQQSSTDANSKKEMNQLLDRLRKVLSPDARKSS